MSPSGIKHATFRLVVQCLNQNTISTVTNGRAGDTWEMLDKLLRNYTVIHAGGHQSTGPQTSDYYTQQQTVRKLMINWKEWDSKRHRLISR